MGQVKTPRSLESFHTHDLRRKRSRAMVEVLRERARYLPETDRALIEAVFADGTPVTKLAGVIGEDPRKLRRRIRRVTGRLLDPRFRFVAERQSSWRPTRRKVGQACVLDGLSIRKASARLQLSFYTVRRHKEAIEAMYELTQSAGAAS
ncbi:MAG TPA: hypothetical protein ENJ00_10390 [Phycisphaerales bacterium]|nr:hypothetical protein [Phycisphaerales bacterium]